MYFGTGSLRALVISATFLAFGAFAKADSIVVQLGAGTSGLFSNGDEVQESGAILTPTLTLDVPETLSFYAPFYGALCTTCSGTVTGTLSTALMGLIVTDESVFGTGKGTFAQGYSDTVAGSTHTFTAQASPEIDVQLSNGDTLEIDPLAGTGFQLSSGNQSTGVDISATFTLVKTSSVPEPASAPLLLLAFSAMALLLRRSRRVQA